MSDCECIEGCPFFNDKIDDMPTLASMYKNKYCKGFFDDCARHIIFEKLGKNFVPVDLFPNEQDKATKVLGI